MFFITSSDSPTIEWPTWLLSAVKVARRGQRVRFHMIRGVVGLNVGGANFTTTAETLRGCPYFETLLSGRFKVARDGAGNVFVDRDGQRFRYILNFLREGTLHVAENDPQKARLVYQELLEEATFFGVETLCVELRERINAIVPPELVMDRENILSEVLGKVERALMQFQSRQHQTPASKHQRGRAVRHTAVTPEAEEALHDFNLNVSF